MLLYVYGTLKRDKWNHGLLKDATFVGEYYTSNDFTLYVDGLPYLTKTSGFGCVGEVYEITPKILKRLDMLEGHPDFYKREIIPVYSYEDGSMVEAWCYLHPDVFNKRTEIVKRF